MLDAIVPVNSMGSCVGYLSAIENQDRPVVMYLGDNADDVPPRLWREFTNVCDGGSNIIVTHQNKYQAYPVHRM